MKPLRVPLVILISSALKPTTFSLKENETKAFLAVSLMAGAAKRMATAGLKVSICMDDTAPAPAFSKMSCQEPVAMAIEAVPSVFAEGVKVAE